MGRILRGGASVFCGWILFCGFLCSAQTTTSISAPGGVIGGTSFTVQISISSPAPNSQVPPLDIWPGQILHKNSDGFYPPFYVPERDFVISPRGFYQYTVFAGCSPSVTHVNQGDSRTLTYTCHTQVVSQPVTIQLAVGCGGCA